MMRVTAVFFSAAATVATLLLPAADAPPRPKILGDAHVAFYVSDLAKARAFYEDFLGYAEPYKLKKPDGSDRIAFIKINEDQYLELFDEPPAQNDGQLNHIAFQTDDAEALRAYLAFKGLKVPAKVGTGQIKNLNFNVNDPDGHTVEMVQYTADSWTRREKGKFLPATRIAARMAHFGALIANLDSAVKFYHEILGFNEFWRGGGSPRVLSWVNMRVPDGKDYFELMLYGEPPTVEQRGTRNHICLEVPDIEKAVATLESRRAKTGYTRDIEIKTGVNRKRQANLFDPDGTRVELMEPNTVDGKPAQSSTAPPPVFSKIP
jgi:catechol 2,3-dioxygenase-like lactoylglutathione lyase family enzyme